MGIDRITYKSAELCDELHIKPSTLRKWALLLQDAGHKFRHDEHGRRIYDDADLALMREFQKLKAMGGATVTSAAKDAVSTINSRQSVRTATDVAGDNFPAIPNEDLLLALQKLAQDNEELKKQNAEQLDVMNVILERIAVLEQRDNDRQSAEEQRLLTNQQPNDSEDVADVAPTKRSWLDRLMGRSGSE